MCPLRGRRKPAVGRCASKWTKCAWQYERRYRRMPWSPPFFSDSDLFARCLFWIGWINRSPSPGTDSRLVDYQDVLLPLPLRHTHNRSPYGLSLPRAGAVLLAVLLCRGLSVRRERRRVRRAGIINLGFQISRLLDQRSRDVRIGCRLGEHEKHACLTSEIVPADHCIPPRTYKNNHAGTGISFPIY
jgi:hypothetical protein